MSIKAIETVYKGYRFRSRAEARWAVFFDAAGIKYLYEPEGVKLSDDTLYLPDFYLPESETWFEVKGVLDDVDKHKVEQLMKDTGHGAVIGYSDLTFQASDQWWSTDFTLTDKSSSVLCRCKKCGKLWFMGYAGSYRCRCCGHYTGDDHFIVCVEGDGDSVWGRYDERVKYALDKARQARFEWGETPT